MSDVFLPQPSSSSDSSVRGRPCPQNTSSHATRIGRTRTISPLEAAQSSVLCPRDSSEECDAPPQAKPWDNGRKIVKIPSASASLPDSLPNTFATRTAGPPKIGEQTNAAANERFSGLAKVPQLDPERLCHDAPKTSLKKGADVARTTNPVDRASSPPDNKEQRASTSLVPQTDIVGATPFAPNPARLGWGLKHEPQRLRNILAPTASEVERTLGMPLGWQASLFDLEVEFVSRHQVRSWLHTDGGLTPTMSWLMSWVLPFHYSPSLPSRAPNNPSEELRRGRLLVVAPNAWWLSDKQMHFQLRQQLVLAAIQHNAPASFERVALYQTQPRIAQYLRDGLHGLMWGLSEVVATALTPCAQQPQSWLRPWTWWNARTPWQRVSHWALSFFAPSELAPRRVGRRIAPQLSYDLKESPHSIVRALRYPGATAAIAAPAGDGAVMRFAVAEADKQYSMVQFRKDVAFWERYNPNGAAVGYSFGV